MAYKRLEHHDGSFQGLQDDWKAQCHQFDEDFEGYVGLPLSTLSELVEDCNGNRHDGVYALSSGDAEYAAVCFTNSAFIPGFRERVLRVRHLVLAPKFDIGEYDAEVYAKLLTDVLDALIELAKSEVDAKHIKVHFRSPADSQVFGEYSRELHTSGVFSNVATHGAWLIVSL